MGNNEFVTLAREVAKELSDDGGRWHSEANGHSVTVVREAVAGGGVRFFRNYSTPKGMVELSGVFPNPPEHVRRSNVDHMLPRHDAHTIKVRADRGAKVIAGEIKRRLLPDYVPALHKWNVCLTDALQGYWRQQTALTTLAAILGSKPQCGPRGDHPEYVTWSPKGTGEAWIEVSADGTSVHLDRGHLTREQAEAVATVLASFG